MSLDVKTDYCYIDRHCYANGEAAPYPGHHCQKCDRYWESISGGSSRSSSGSSSGSSPATTAKSAIGKLAHSLMNTHYRRASD